MAVKDWLPAAVHATGIERVLDPGETLFRIGDPVSGIYEILKGRVQLTRVDATGREVVLYTAGAGDLFAEASLFAPKYHCDAVSRTGATVRRFPKGKVLAALRGNPKAAEAFMALMAREIMRLRTRLEERSIRSAHDCVRHFLALNVGADGRTVALRGTVKDLAAEIGLTHEALYRVLADLAAGAEIRRIRNGIVLTAV
jgi:CRP/FNR family transcriptional regulator, dissimilatory nitrate respiration regulator